MYAGYLNILFIVVQNYIIHNYLTKYLIASLSLGVLSSDDLGSVEDVQEACGEMLAELIRSHREVHQKTEEEAVRSVCEDLFQAIGYVTYVSKYFILKTTMSTHTLI